MAEIKHQTLLMTFDDCGDDKEKVEHYLNTLGVDNYVVAEGLTNGYTTIMIPPSGSKEGRQHDVSHRDRISKVVNFLIKEELTVEWVVLNYGFATAVEIGPTNMLKVVSKSEVTIL